MEVMVFPNPATDRTTFGFELSEKSLVLVNIYDRSGRKVAELGNSILTKGFHQIDYNTSGLEAGVYLYSITTDEGIASGRLVVN